MRLRWPGKRDLEPFEIGQIDIGITVEVAPPAPGPGVDPRSAVGKAVLEEIEIVEIQIPRRIKVTGTIHRRMSVSQVFPLSVALVKIGSGGKVDSLVRTPVCASGGTLFCGGR